MPTIASAATIGSTHAAPTAAVATVAAVAPASTTHATAVAVSTSAPAAKAASSATTKTYTVVAGDTLFGIAQRSLGNGNDYHKLFDLNKGRSESGGATFTNPDLIDVGWTLLVPTGGASASSDGKAAPATTGDSGSSATTKTTTGSTTTVQTRTATTYADNLDGWINQAISILNAHGYSVSYNAIYQTAMNESSGNPDATNGWDSNAAAGTPSIGLMQVIQPTFDAYALPGYGDIYNPVDNIIAAVIYAQHTYGGLDNVVAARCGGSCWYGY
jgi:LysM repeat protein